jgi:hypothetical protein
MAIDYTCRISTSRLSTIFQKLDFYVKNGIWQPRMKNGIVHPLVYVNTVFRINGVANFTSHPVIDSRVTRCVCEKIAQSVAQTTFCQN